jgi:hypothetical protein
MDTNTDWYLIDTNSVKGGDWLIMNYFNNFDDECSNKYKKIKKYI